MYTRTCPTDTLGPAYRWVPLYTQAQLLQQLVAQVIWLDPTTVAVTTLTAATPGLSVTATLTPTKMTVTPADHDPIVCNPNVTQPTQQFLDDHPPLEPTDTPLACEIRFTKTSKDQPNLKYPTTIQVAWNMTWTTTAGGTGTIPGVTTIFPRSTSPFAPATREASPYSSKNFFTRRPTSSVAISSFAMR